VIAHRVHARHELTRMESDIGGHCSGLTRSDDGQRLETSGVEAVIRGIPFSPITVVQSKLTRTIN
jgi:hypothetical protein